ncbi:MAG: KH domain-containing protein [Anaerolineae bacterium]|nr:KH domain-containing protein [Anaerolineae bacterium]
MAEDTSGSKALLEYIVKSVVDNPDEVQVTEAGYAREKILQLQVAAPDMGRVIGKGGRVINSIRALVQVAAAKEGAQVTVEILE